MALRKRIVAGGLYFFMFIYPVIGAAGVSAGESDSTVIGEAFGKPVTSEEFYYYYKTAFMFTRTGKETREDEEIRSEAWQNLIYSHAAQEENITVSREELEAELNRLMAEKNIEYGTENYYEWVAEEVGEDVSQFERRIRDLLVINKFMDIKTNPEVIVTEEEMKQKFLNQYNSFESEYIMFDSRDDAEKFAKDVKRNKRLWYDTYREKKALGQKGATWINIMSLEALIDLWKIPKDDAYRILDREPGDFIVAENYYGIAVFRLLRKKRADMSKYNDKKKEYYRKTMTMARKRKIVKKYFEDLLARADYRDYIAEQRHREKVERMKTKSHVVLETNRGKIELNLFPEIAPKACENFIGLVEKGYYNGIIFHRVIADFMIQAGDPTGTGTGGESIWKKPFRDEVSEEVTFDKPGILAMANSGPNTNTSQFFITVKKTPWLNKRHTIFGEVVAGFDVVERISKVETDSSDKPKEEQRILKAYIKKGKK